MKNRNDLGELNDILFARLRALDDPDHYVRDLQLLLELESRCDVVFMTGDWESSLGCQTEYDFATRQGIPIAETYADLLAILTSVEKGELD